MKFLSYWHDSCAPFSHASAGPVAGRVDVAVIGAGFTGLSAALSLARQGVSVALLEAQQIGAGGSGRNGGHLNNGLAHGYGAAKTHLGAARAHALYKAFDTSIEAIETVIAQEGIACDFRRAGKLKLASKPSHVADLRANFELIQREVDPQTAWIERGDLGAEVGTNEAHGAMLCGKSAMMHMGKYVVGLAQAVVRHGGVIWEQAPVIAREKYGTGWRITTPKGVVQAERVILATGAYSGAVASAPLGWFRRRMINVGSFIIATRPLTPSEIAPVSPR